MTAAKTKGLGNSMKFVFVIFVNPTFGYFMINSKPSKFVLKEDPLGLNQLKISNYEFMSKPHSYIDCTNIVWDYTTHKFNEMVKKKIITKVGTIKKEDLKKLKKIVAESKRISYMEKEEILSSI